MFERMVQAAFPLEKECELSSADFITYGDANMIRYAAGYVCRKVKEKIIDSALLNKPTLMKCVMGLLEEGEADASPSADWLAGQGWIAACKGGHLHAVLCHGRRALAASSDAKSEGYDRI